MDIKLIRLQTHGDDRGSLISLEHNNNIHFDIKRVYYMFNTLDDVRRGCHAHRNLKQLVIAVRGSCRFILDNGRERIELLLDNPAQGLLLDSMIWREMHQFSEDCVLMVLADQVYDEYDYIRSYSDFIEIMQREFWNVPA